MYKFLVRLITLFLFLLYVVCVKASITCKDNDNNAVDWYVVYKLPKSDGSPHETVKQGLGYYYLDVNTPSWTFGQKSMNDSGQAVSNTLQQLYSNYKSDDVLYLVYNDETPEKKVSYYHGHTKGDLAFDKESGFWLVHSVPRFPPYINSSYSYPHSGRTYGQTFLCVTYPYSQLDLIGQQLLYTYPSVWDHNTPSSFLQDNPNLAAVLAGTHITQQPWNKRQTLLSKDNQQFISFAKYSRFDADLYHDWVAPVLAEDLLVESWLNGVGKMPSNCSGQYQALNIETVAIGDTKFTSTKDHSKWAVTTSSSNGNRSGNTNKNWICIGDINREESQKNRSGGTVCANLPQVWKTFFSGVVETEKCHKDLTTGGWRLWNNNL